VRLKNEEISVLKEAVLHFMGSAQVYLFGSRVDDTARGGDIDILVRGDRKLTLIEKAQIRASYYRRFGERKIDLLSVKFGEENSFVNLILDDAVLLQEPK